jgi:hypothetical protein
MPIRIQSDANFRADLLSLEGLVEYSTDTLVFLSPSLLDSLTFSWIGPTNSKFQERLMYRDISRDETGLFAYSATIYPVFTAGVRGDVGQVIVSFRSGALFSPIIKVPVNKSVIPEQTQMPVSQYDEIGVDLLVLHAKDALLEAEDTRLDAVDVDLQSQIDAKSEDGHVHVEANITDLDKYSTTEADALLVLKADLVGGKVPASQLPAYVDDVLEYADFASFPATGTSGIVYIDNTEGDIYRWGTSAYIQISDVLSAAEIKTLYEQNSNTNAFTDALANKLNGIASGAQVNVITSVNGKVGIVVITTDDVAEGSTNKYYGSSLFDVDFATKDTDDLVEGIANLYFTELRVTNSNAIEAAALARTTHEELQNNIHNVTKLQVGLGDAENTTDLDKPISNLAQAALDDKADLIGGKVDPLQLPSFVGTVSEVATYADLPTTGDSGTLYIVLADEISDNNASQYRWATTVYVQITDTLSASEVKSLYEANADTNVFNDAYQAAVNANTAKVGITAQESADIITNNAKVAYSEALVTANIAADVLVAANTAKIGITITQANEIAANTLKTGITIQQALDIVTNNAKITYDAQVAVANNTAKVGITLVQAANIVDNNAKITYDAQAEVAANTVKVTYDDQVDVGLNTAHRALEDNPHVVTKDQVGLGNVDNTSDLDKPVSTLQAAIHAFKADLVGGIVPIGQLPSYVDDVIEFADEASFPIEGTAGKIYIALDTNETFRWATTLYVKIGDVLSAADVKSLYESNANTNEFNDAEKTKLGTIEDLATADQSDAEIKIAYENNADTNEFNDAEKVKLGLLDPNAAATFEGLTDTPSEVEMQAAPLGSFLAVAADGTLTNFVTLVNASSTGVIEGLQLSINGINSNQIDIASGRLVIVTLTNDPLDYNGINADLVDYAGITGVPITTMATGEITYISLSYNSGTEALTIVMRNTAPSAEQRRQEVTLGIVSHYDYTNIFNVQSTPIIISQPLHSAIDFEGKISKKDGLIYSGVSGVMQISHTSGSLVGYGINSDINQSSPNTRLIPTSTPVGFLPGWRNGTSGLTVGTPTNVFDSTKYDDGTGVLATIPSNNNAVVHRIYMTGEGATMILYGQVVYGTVTLAREAYNANLDTIDDIPLEVLKNLVLVAILITAKDTTDLSDAGDAIFLTLATSGGSSSGGSSTITAVDDLDVTITSLLTNVNGATQKTVNEAIDVKIGLHDAHALNVLNPHTVTKLQVGLGNVDDTSDLVKPISTLTQAALDLKAPSVHQHVEADITDLDKYTQAEVLALTWLESDITDLDKYTQLQTDNLLLFKADLVGGLIPSSQLPSFIDDVLEYADFAALPVEGEAGKMYVTIDDNIVYRWSGSIFVAITSSMSAAGIKALYESNPNTNVFTDAYVTAVLTNTAKTGITAQQAIDIATNNSKISYTDQAVVAANTAKVGITIQQALDIVSNNAKVTYDDQIAVGLNTAKISYDDAAVVAVNTAKVGYTEALVSANTNVTANTIHRDSTGATHSDVVANSAKVGYTELLVSANVSVAANTAKISYTDEAAVIANTAKVGYTELLVTANIAADLLVAANTAKAGITPTQAADIVTNNAKVGFTNALADARVNLIVGAAGPAYDTLVEIQALMEADDTEIIGMLDAIGLNTAKITYDDAAAVALNTAKVGITIQQAADIVTNNAKLTADANATNQGNTFNGLSQLVQLNSSGQLPALDGSLLTGLEAGATVSVSDTAPVAPDNGDLWYDSVKGDLKVYYVNVWVDASPEQSFQYGLGDLANVDLETVVPVNGDTFVYNGTDWVPGVANAMADTDELSEGAINLYYTEARVSANTDVAANTAKISYDDAVLVAQHTDAIALNTDKITYDDAALVAQHTIDIAALGGTLTCDVIGSEILAVPTTGWALDGVLTDFYAVNVTITGTFTANDAGQFNPIITTAAIKTAWQDMELIDVQRVDDSTIRLYATAANTTAFNFEFVIIKDGAGV